MTTIREKILEGALETDEAFDDGQVIPADEVEARIAEAVAGERERCAQLVENLAPVEHVAERREVIDGFVWVTPERTRQRFLYASTVAAAIRGDNHALRSEQSADAGGER